MNIVPTSLKPDAAAWVQAQLAINHARTSAAAQSKVAAVDQWTSGLFIALRDVLFHVLINQLDLGRHLASDWKHSADQFDAIDAGTQSATEEINLDVLEARKMLYCAFTELGLMPK